MLQMSVDTRAIERRLNAVAKSQLPFAVALGINEVAGQISDTEQSGLARDLDRPTAFTKRGLTVARASKRRLVGVVGFKPIQADYLKLQATGGKRRAKGRAVVVPVGQRLNKYGNMPRGAVKRALAKPDVFVASAGAAATKHLAPGIYQRPAKGKYYRGRMRGGKFKGSGAATGFGNKNVGKQKGPKLLVAFESQVKYSPRMRFVQRATAQADRTIGPAIARNLKRAVKTAR